MLNHENTVLNKNAFDCSTTSNYRRQNEVKYILKKAWMNETFKEFKK